MRKGKQILAVILSAAMLYTAMPAGIATAVDVVHLPAASAQPQPAADDEGFVPSAPGTGVQLGDGVSWPLGQALPSFRTPAQPLDIVKINDMHTQATMTCLEGIVNRKKPRMIVYTGYGSDIDAEQASWADETGLELGDTLTTYQMIQKYKDEINGLVVYDPNQLDTINLATTYAGVYDCIPVLGNMADVLTKAPYNLEIKADYRGMFSDYLEVYTYLYENLWEHCNKRLLVSLKPDGSFGARDMATATRAACTWLDATKEADVELMDKMYCDYLPNESYMFGWWEEEWPAVQYAGAYGMQTLGANYYNNVTVYGGQSKELNQPTVPKKPELHNKIYVALAVSDGDNLQYNMHHMRSSDWWGSPLRGKIPITWTTSPAMLDAGPQILNYYYRSATDKDYLITGPSGLGYTMTEVWDSGQFSPEKYVQYTNDYFEKTGLNMATVWNNLGSYGEMIADNCPAALGFTVQDLSLVCEEQPMNYYGENQTPFLSLGSVLNYISIDQTTNRHETLIKKFREFAALYDGTRPMFLMTQVHPWAPSTLDRLIAFTNQVEREFGDLDIEYVRADHLFMLMAESQGMYYNVGLRANATASGADGAATADKAVDGSFAKDKGWASSNSGDQWLQLDLGQEYTLNRYTIKNAATGYFPAAENSKAWQFAYSLDGKSWKTADSVSGNADNIVYRKLASEVTARYVRVQVEDPGASGVARIQDLEVYGRAPDQIEDGLQYDAYNYAYYYENGEPVKNAWRTEGGVKYYFGADGIGKTGWFAVEGKWYFSDSNAEVQTGWFKDKGTWYFADGTGVMATGWKKMGSWFYFGTNGKMRTGWFQVGSKWYFADSAGKMKTGWFKDKGKWYYSDSSGAMATGWKKLGSKWYYLGSDGKMRTGWYKVGKTWYYSDSSGKMKTGWFAVGKKWYFTNGSGSMQTGWLKTGGKWYWLNSSGAMQTGWKKLGSKWYWFDGSGKMLAATSRKIGGKIYRFGGSGVCLNP